MMPVPAQQLVHFTKTHSPVLIYSQLMTLTALPGEDTNRYLQKSLRRMAPGGDDPSEALAAPGTERAALTLDVGVSHMAKPK